MITSLMTMLLGFSEDVMGSELGERPAKSAREVGFTQHWGELPESSRLKKRAEAGWSWTFPGESPEYRAVQERRSAEILDLYHYQERLDNWVQYTQVRSVVNFTRLGFGVVDAPPELHERLKERLHASLKQGLRKEMGGKPQGIFGDEWPEFVNHGEPKLLQQLQGLHEEWAPSAGPLTPVTAYGMRVYRRGASLGWHADRVDTHIISSILHVDRLYDDESKPWAIEIEGHDGERHQVALKPGQMLLYESAKCPHGRSTALEGDWYAALFSHFQPAPDKWPYSQQDIWLAVPPNWDAAPLTHSGSGRWAGAFLTHDSMAVAGMEARDPRDLHASTKLRATGLKAKQGQDYADERAMGHYEAQRPFAKVVKDQLDAALKGVGGEGAGAKATEENAHPEKDNEAAAAAVNRIQATKPPSNFSVGKGVKKTGLQAFKVAAAAKQATAEAEDKMHRLGMTPDEAAAAVRAAEGEADDVVATVRKLAAMEVAEKATANAKKANAKKAKNNAKNNNKKKKGQGGAAEPALGLKGQVLEAVEATLEVTGFGLSFLAVLGFFASGGTLVGCGLLLKRVLLTKGRSLTRPSHLKKDMA
mmetsp:Transcript_27593/g.55539  ORF Transcript_27593/g.55539 Transcript_27593/m.55539 type:complete len:589 (+) Transcript_27593:71-1837(+)